MNQAELCQYLQHRWCWLNFFGAVPGGIQQARGNANHLWREREPTHKNSSLRTGPADQGWVKVSNNGWQQKPKGIQVVLHISEALPRNLWPLTKPYRTHLLARHVKSNSILGPCFAAGRCLWETRLIHWDIGPNTSIEKMPQEFTAPESKSSPSAFLHVRSVGSVRYHFPTGLPSI